MKCTGKPVSKSNPLRLVPEKPKAPLRLSGLEPAPEMVAGQYVASCVIAHLERSKNRAALQFVVIEGRHAGTAVPMWINGINGAIQPTSRYAKECAAALGRDLTAQDDLDPEIVFKGRHFVVEVGWRLTDRPGGGVSKDEHAEHRKDGRDFLRVHHVIHAVEL